ncbi:hypothetical protein B0O99DRAFT_614689 [Bisporella sp. PMI_857]|nr:hypothetical protein B0O99DRAFT_614689 [Bisporella sp. PMI_857]
MLSFNALWLFLLYSAYDRRSYVVHEILMRNLRSCHSLTFPMSLFCIQAFFKHLSERYVCSYFVEIICIHTICRYP